MIVKHYTDTKKKAQEWKDLHLQLKIQYKKGFLSIFLFIVSELIYKFSFVSCTVTLLSSVVYIPVGLASL